MSGARVLRASLSTVLSLTKNEASRKLLQQDDTNTGAVFLVGLCMGVFGVALVLLFIMVCLYYLRRSRRSWTVNKTNLEMYETRQPIDKKRSSEGRVSFMRSTSVREPSFQAIEHLELDKIELGASLGKGAFGRVYKGEYEGIPLAIKVFEHDGTVLCQGNEPLETYLSRNTDHPNVVKTLVNETRRMASMASELSLMKSSVIPSRSSDLKPTTSSGSDDEFSYIARAMETVDSDDSYRTWIVMEFCEMGSLDQAIKSNMFFRDGVQDRPDLKSMLLTAIDIASALEYLHRQRIVHGDLKSQNVLLKKSIIDQRGFVCKVGDFGLSRMIINKTHIDTFTHGTVSHSAPELFKQGLLTPAADVYSFGILLWELFTGKKAYVGTEHSSIIIAVTRGLRPILPVHCPIPLAALISECWDDSHLQRPTFQTVLECLHKMLEDIASLEMSTFGWSREHQRSSSASELERCSSKDIDNKKNEQGHRSVHSLRTNGSGEGSQGGKRIEALSVSTENMQRSSLEKNSMIDSISEMSMSGTENDLEAQEGMQTLERTN